ncbi:hypothetical protein [Escherichia coli]|uniref:hypothetical protein n=1 Tax=Escherichia coli TaxID=562 RepID=UPI000D6F0DDC|nr:hypothetical protein [Escherichia coli]
MNRSIITYAATGVMLVAASAATGKTFIFSHFKSTLVTSSNLSGIGSGGSGWTGTSPDGRPQLITRNSLGLNYPKYDIEQIGSSVNTSASLKYSCESDTGKTHQIRLELGEGLTVGELEYSKRPGINGGSDKWFPRGTIADRYAGVFTVPRLYVCSTGVNNLEEIEMTYTVYGLIQKWWDDIRPNQLTWEHKGVAVYKAVSNGIGLYFSPNVITISGQAGTDLQTATNLTITTDGSSHIRITWPKIAGVKYLDNTHWVDETDDIISVSSTHHIRKTIQISGDLGVGQKSIAIPVTGETV